MENSILVLQNDPEVLPGHVLEWLIERKRKYQIIESYNPKTWHSDEKIFSDRHPGLVILGGEPNVDEEHIYPWLTSLKLNIREWLKKEKPTLGICLGGQLLAEHYGARVYRRESPEIGWHRVSTPEPFEVFCWHYYQFELPKGARILFSSESCPVQGFEMHNNVLGLQFHPEVDAASARSHVENFKMPKGPFVQTSEQVLAGAIINSRRGRDYLFKEMDRLFLGESKPQS